MDGAIRMRRERLPLSRPAMDIILSAATRAQGATRMGSPPFGQYGAPLASETEYGHSRMYVAGDVRRQRLLFRCMDPRRCNEPSIDKIGRPVLLIAGVFLSWPLSTAKSQSILLSSPCRWSKKLFFDHLLGFRITINSKRRGRLRHRHLPHSDDRDCC